MTRGQPVRFLVSATLLLGLAACVPERNWSPISPLATAAPGQLILNNYRFEEARVQAVVTAAPDCARIDASMPAMLFDLPFKGTHVVTAAPDTDICWRRVVPGGAWTQWNRAFTAAGRSIDARL
jgi:hypothetical protein